jgi:hypothetical protein
MEPVSSSLAGSCFPPLLIFRRANMLNTRVATATTLNRVLRLGVRQGTTKRFRIGKGTPTREGAFRLAQREGNLTALRLINS